MSQTSKPRQLGLEWTEPASGGEDRTTSDDPASDPASAERPGSEIVGPAGRSRPESGHGRVAELAPARSGLVAEAGPPTLGQRTAEMLGLEHAHDPNVLGFMAKFLVMCTLPHRDPRTSIYERTNGNLTLTILNKPSVGLPYGRYARLLMAWICTEAVRTQSPELHPGSSMADFLRRLELPRTAGVAGTIPRLREQMHKILTSTISVSAKGTVARGNATWSYLQDAGSRIGANFSLWQKPSEKDVEGTIEAQIRLSREFYEAIVHRPVPLDLKVFHSLRAPLAMDLYVWLGYRAHVLRRSGRDRAEIPWDLLEGQMGANFKRPRAFRENVLKHLGRVMPHLHGVKVEDRRGRLEIRLGSDPAVVILDGPRDAVGSGGSDGDPA
ncbi:MAG: hypothetical protein MI919_41640 [Holophagales bacterium]|nr:hypothetical protein [Holophagales bacterium]